MGAIVIGFNASGWIVGVNVERIEMCADLFYWSEVLDHCSSAFEDSTLHCSWIAWEFISIIATALSGVCHFAVCMLSSKVVFTNCE